MNKEFIVDNKLSFAVKTKVSRLSDLIKKVQVSKTSLMLTFDTMPRRGVIYNLERTIYGTQKGDTTPGNISGKTILHMSIHDLKTYLPIEEWDFVKKLK